VIMNPQVFFDLVVGAWWEHGRGLGARGVSRRWASVAGCAPGAGSGLVEGSGQGGGLVLEFVDDGLVGVAGEAGGGVAEGLFDDAGVDAGGQGVGGCAVA
jgi:hypothetical protein